MNFYTLSHTGVVRPNNEDYADSVQFKWCSPSGIPGSFTALILADGMGGAANGEFASQTAVETVKSNVIDVLFKLTPEQLLDADLEVFLSDAFTQANEKVFAKSRENPEMEGMGTTLVVALIFNEILTLAHIGDSRCYLLREGKFRQLTRDHSLVQELVDQGKITADQAKIHPHKNVITRALGVNETIEGDCLKLPLFTGDVLLLCSDGLTGYADERAVRRLVREQGEQPTADLKTLAETLVQEANAGGGGDNVSVCLYRHVAF